MNNLFDIEQEYIQLVQELEENGGELTDEILDRLNINRNELKQKLDNYRFVIETINGEILTLENEVKRLTNKIKTKNNVIDRLKERITEAVKLYGERTKTGTLAVTSNFAKFTYIATKKVVINSELDPITNPTLSQFTTVDVSLLVKPHQLALLKLLLVELNPTLKITPIVDKKAIGVALSTPQIGLPFVDDSEESNLIDPTINVSTIAHIDTSSGYVRMS